MISKKTYRPVLAALTVMLLGLFMLCAHQQTIETPGEDLSGGDQEFRQELLEMLDLANDGQDTAMFAATDDAVAGTSEVAVTDDPSAGNSEMEGSNIEAASTDELGESDEAELLALLAGLEEEAADSGPADAGTTTEELEPIDDVAGYAAEKGTESAGDLAYAELMKEVQRLEMILEQRSVQVDSLRRIIDNRSARIVSMETNLASASSYKPAVRSVDAPAPVIVSTNTSKTYNPIHASSGPYTTKYEQGRRQFESFDYQGCIATMTALIQEDPNNELADNAQYWIGEAYYGLKDYQKAILELQKVFAYTQTDKFDDAQLMIGLSYVRAGQSEMARTTFGDFLETYSGSEYTNVAKRYYYNI